MGCGLSAQAHPNLQDAMRVQFEPHLVRVFVNVSLTEISVAQGVAASYGSRDTPALNRAAQNHRVYLPKHLTISAGTNALKAKVVGLTPPPRFEGLEESFYVYELEYQLTGPPPKEVAIAQNMLCEWPYAIGTPWEVSYVVRSQRFGSTETDTDLLQSEESVKFATGWNSASSRPTSGLKVSAARTFREYLWYGVMHILTGWDHLLFVCALVIATRSFWEMLKVIAAFTLAHTFTLTLSVFDIFRLSAAIVEPVIALSIVLVALENVFWPQRAHSGVRLVVAFGFGLIHGLGFAGGLLNAMQGLPSIGIGIALAAFSLGVEIGHQVVVLPVFGLLTLTRHQRHRGYYPSLLRYGSAAISCCGAYYLVVALHAQFFSR